MVKLFIVLRKQIEETREKNKIINHTEKKINTKWNCQGRGTDNEGANGIQLEVNERRTDSKELEK